MVTPPQFPVSACKGVDKIDKLVINEIITKERTKIERLNFTETSRRKLIKMNLVRKLLLAEKDNVNEEMEFAMKGKTACRVIEFS